MYASKPDISKSTPRLTIRYTYGIHVLVCQEVSCCASHVMSYQHCSGMPLDHSLLMTTQVALGNLSVHCQSYQQVVFHDCSMCFIFDLLVLYTNYTIFCNHTNLAKCDKHYLSQASYFLSYSTLSQHNVLNVVDVSEKCLTFVYLYLDKIHGPSEYPV